MAEFKLNISDPKSGKTHKRDVKDDEAKAFNHKKIGDKISGDTCGLAGYEFEISGGSDYCGFPMRRDVSGTARKRILIVNGVGIRQKRKGKRIRKSVAGNTIYSKTSQINLKILKYGKEKLGEAPKEEKKEGEAPKEEKAEKKEAAKKEEPKKEEVKEEKKDEKTEKKEDKGPEQADKPAPSAEKKPEEKPKAEESTDNK